MIVKGTIITCPYCGTKFPHSGRVELQVCPKCDAELLVGGNPSGTEAKDIPEAVIESLKNLLPQSPNEGPPLPKGLAIKWPWKEES